MRERTLFPAGKSAPQCYRVGERHPFVLGRYRTSCRQHPEAYQSYFTIRYHYSTDNQLALGCSPYINRSSAYASRSKLDGPKAPPSLAGHQAHMEFTAFSGICIQDTGYRIQDSGEVVRQYRDWQTSSPGPLRGRVRGD